MLETDDDDFSLTPSSNLSAIFETPPEATTGTSLTYRAPKQPNNSAPKPPPAEPKKSEAQSSVILAKVITLWKLDNGKNVSMGKYMVALIGNSTTNNLIVYQDKTKILIRLPLGQSLSFFKYPNNFVAFYDANKQLWNMNFDDLQAKNEFLDCVKKYDSIVIEQVEESSSKEKILGRISKMGQSILNAHNISDSESSLSSDPLPPKATRKPKRNLVNQERALAPVCNENYHHLMSTNQMMFNNQGLMPDYGFNSFMIAQNAELKANLAEINLKLNSVLCKGDKNGNNEEDLKSKIKYQNLKIDNLTTDLNRSRKAFEELHRKYAELDDRRKMCDDAEVQVAALKEKLLKMEGLEDEVEALKQENLKVEELNVKIINCEEAINKAEAELKEKDKKIEIQSLKLKDFEEYFKENENVKKENADLRQQLEELTRKLEDFDKSKSNANSWVLDKFIINKLVKEGMNQAYANIMANFEENDEEYYSFGEIQTVLLENLKKTSYSLMNSLSE